MVDKAWLVFPQVVPFGDPAYDSGLGGAHDLDVKPPPNFPVYALKPGSVSDISSPDWGKQVGVLLDTPIQGVPNMAYLHLSAVRSDLQIGSKVSKGDLIGWVGGANTAAQYLGTTNPTGANFLNSPNSSSQVQIGLGLMRGSAYGGAGWETFPPVDWALDPTPTLDAARKEYWLNASPVVNRLGRVGLFMGADESFSFTLSEWLIVANFCVAHKINFVLIKTFESTQGDWFPGSNFDNIYTTFTRRGIQVVPYGFLYGSGVVQNGRSLDWEISMLERYMATYGVVCADMEGSWWNGNAGDAQRIHDALVGKPGLFLLSLPADPDIATFRPLAPIVDMAMPMAYSDTLTAVYPNNMAAIGNMPVGPTFDLSQEFGPNNLPFNVSHSVGQPQITFWYHDFAQKNPALLDQLVSIAGSLPAGSGGTMGVPTGWTDDGSALHNPQNSFVVRGAFRTTVLNWPSGWPAWNVPVENEHTDAVIAQSNPGLGGGPNQLFADYWMIMLQSQGNKISAGWMGSELVWYKGQLVLADTAVDNDDAIILNLHKQLADDDIALAAANAQVSDLKTQLDACIAHGGTLTDAQKKALADGEAAFTELKAAFNLP